MNNDYILNITKIHHITYVSYVSNVPPMWFSYNQITTTFVSSGKFLLFW
jgi:hypothetical protein